MALAEDEQVSAFKHTRVVLKAASDAAQESYAAVPMLRWHLEKSCIASIFTRILCIREEGHRLAGNVCGEEVAETIHDLCGEKEVTSIESSWLSKMRNLIELNAFRTFHMDHLYLTKGHLHVHVTWLSETLKLGSGDENSKCVLRCTRVEIFSSNRKQLGLWVEATMIPIYCIKN
uniref:AlNc14C1595G13010 protein n=1 Tax=Albugo laibachii Nc14 TaxID=890382 RepID=F0X2S6_9STRA|nr:AlNc14C1595G13010 [Albugo laibachii Nc14]|eukprot:CCA28227.1 AlNc14C1595G13010 [Albugo laibachii Nc14]